MEADIYITTRRKIDGIDPYTYDSKGRPVYYYRDSYNPTNLAWLINKSYWVEFWDSPEEFLKSLADIDPKSVPELLQEKIRSNSVYKAMCESLSQDRIERLVEMLVKKIEFLRKGFEAGIVEVDYSI